jgi:CelD/BcsL family acetyltransferase involved in cellulose biosynthesis
MGKVRHGETEEDWAEVLLDVVIAQREKSLASSGTHHAFTEYRQLKDFVNEKNLAEARAQSPNPRLRNATIDDLNEGTVQGAEIPSRLTLFTERRQPWDMFWQEFVV